MRIAFFADAFPDVSVTFIMNQVAGLLERGHEVQVFAQTEGRHGVRHPLDLDWNLKERTQYIGPPVKVTRRATAVIRRLLGSRRPGLLRTLFPIDPSFEARTGRLFFAASAFSSRSEFDVIHCHFGLNGNVAVRLRQLGLLRAPVVTTFHGYDMRAGVASHGDCYRRLRTGGDAFLSISGYNRRLLEDWGFPRERIHHHPVGIDPAEFPFRGPRDAGSGPVRILTVANLVQVKGHEYLLQALGALRNAPSRFDFELRLAGEGPERRRLESLCQELSLERDVEFLGPLDQRGVLGELEHADLFVLPSLAEATPVALMEAQSVGLPVIATRVGAVEEVVRDGVSGWLVESGSAEALTRALVDAVAARSAWGPMGEAGREHVSNNYSIRLLIKRLERIYQSLRP